jgi:hypothetical protein
MKNQKHKSPLPATDSMPGPGEFPLGSVESRAAARVRVQKSLEGRVRETFLLIGFGHSNPPRTKANIGEWFENKDGSLERNVSAPSDMSEEDALEIFGTRTNPLRGKIGFYGIRH